jgi:hypothetical protein
LYVLLRSLVEKEGLAAISIDCLSFSFSGKPPLPLPCLAFTRLRDEGITAPCEADVCALLTSVVLQEISRKPAYQCNVAEVNMPKSIAVLRHCVAPVRLMGRNAPPLAYNLRDYHGMGKGATVEVEFPMGIDVTLGLFSKDLQSFILWPGKHNRESMISTVLLLKMRRPPIKGAQILLQSTGGETQRYRTVAPESCRLPSCDDCRNL